MRRRSLALLLVLAAIGTSAGFAFVSTPPASADVCSKLPGLPIVPNPIKTVCKGLGTVTKIVSDPIKIITDPIRAIGDDVMRGVTSWVADGAAWLLGQAAALINQTTTPTLGAAWFTGQYATMAGLAAVFALPLLFLAVLEGVLKRDGRIIVRAAGVHLPAAFLLTAGAVVVVGMLVALTDQMCGQLTGSVSGQASSFFSDVSKSLSNLASQTGSGPAVPLFAVFLGGLIAAVGSFFVWIELLIRAAAIYVAVLFLPFTFVAMIWPQTARWCRRLVELLFAIVFSKFAIVAIMALAAAGLLSGGSSTGFTGVLAGAALMLLAAFSPLALLRLLPMVEGAAHAHANRSGAGSQTLGPVAGPAAVMRRVVDGNWGSGGSGLRAAPAAAGAGPAGIAASAGGAARGATRAASDAANGGAAGRETAAGRGSAAASGGPGATPGQDGGRYAATNGSTSSPAGRPASGGGPAQSRPPAGSSSQGHDASAAPGTSPAAPSAQTRRSSSGRGAPAPATPAGAAPRSPGGSAPSSGSFGPSTPQAASPARPETSRPPLGPSRDPARERANDQQTGRES